MTRAILVVVAMCVAGVPAAFGIEAAFVPDAGGGGDYLVRVEPDLVRGGNAHTFTSDVPPDARDVRRVKIYVADAWPPAVERVVLDAAKRPRIMPAVATAPVATVETAGVVDSRPWPLLVGVLGFTALFVWLVSHRQRILAMRDIEQAKGIDIAIGERIAEGVVR